MDSLYKGKINGFSVFAVGIFILIVAPGISFLNFVALMIAAYQFALLFYSFNYVIPIRYLAGSLMCLQFLVGPTFAYMGLDEYQYFKYKMQVPEWDYYSYAIPAVICFILGLNINSKLKGEFINKESIMNYVKAHPKMIYIFIIGGFVSSVIASFFGSEFGFVFYLLGNFKFIGAFLLIIGGVRLKPLPIIIVFGSIIASSLGSSMFHDLITWLIFLLAILAIKYQPPMPVKTAIGVGFIVLVVVIQQLKGAYREANPYGGNKGNLSTFGTVYTQQKNKGALFDKVSLAQSNVRISQGFILSHIIKHIPKKEPYANGEELYKILEAAFLPRILAPNKLKAGDNKLVRKYSGIQLTDDTSMSLSAPGDGYINFGLAGGCIFMFVLGGFFNFVLVKFEKISRKVPLALLFTPLVFYFPIRPDTALQTGLGHLVKACFLLYFILVVWRHHFEQLPKSFLQKMKKGVEENLTASQLSVNP